MYAPTREWNEDDESDTDDAPTQHSPSTKLVPDLDEAFVEYELQQPEVHGEEEWVDL